MKICKKCILFPVIVFTFTAISSLLAFSNEDIYGLMDTEKLEKLIAEKEIILKENPQDINNLKAIGIAYHNLSVIGKKNASKKAFVHLQKAYKLASNDYEILAYLGSVRTLLGRDAIIPFVKLYQVHKGTRLIDKAISKAPDNVIIRIVRIKNSLALPSFFNRAKYAKKDISYLFNRVKKGELKLPPDIMAILYYEQGEVYRREGKWDKAISYWKEAVKIAPKSYDAKRAVEKLKIYE